MCSSYWINTNLKLFEFITPLYIRLYFSSSSFKDYFWMSNSGYISHQNSSLIILQLDFFKCLIHTFGHVEALFIEQEEPSGTWVEIIPFTYWLPFLHSLFTGCLLQASFMAASIPFASQVSYLHRKHLNPHLMRCVYIWDPKLIHSRVTPSHVFFLYVWGKSRVCKHV